MVASTLELEIASTWLIALGEAFAQASVESFISCLDKSCWLRDILVFIPSVETRRGHDAIRTHIQSKLGEVGVSNLKLDTNPFGRPRASEFVPGTPIVETAFDFETPNALGKGYARLYYPKDDESPRAFCLMMMLDDWKGHEEVKNESGLYGGHTISWSEVYRQRRNEVEKDPEVIIGTLSCIFYC